MNKNITQKRTLKIKVKNAKGRKIASTQWLQRQLNDPYVKEAQNQGYRSRAAFKIIEIDQKYHIIKNQSNIIDLGAAPGGWSQVIAQKINQKTTLIALDKKPIEPIKNTITVIGDFLEHETINKIRNILKEKANLILSDMADNATGHQYTDHLRSIQLCEAVLEFANQNLAPDGNLLLKLLKGTADQELTEKIKKNFQKIYYIKPKASRKQSNEIYILATQFKNPNPSIQ